LVIPAADTTKVAVAGALALNVLGVAANDVGLRTSQDGQNPANIAQAPDYVAVYYGVDIDVTYNANAANGILLVTAAGGKVTPYTAGTSLFDQIVGRCSQPGGVTVSSLAVGSARIGF
jgi:hypothetical protein